MTTENVPNETIESLNAKIEAAKSRAKDVKAHARTKTESMADLAFLESVQAQWKPVSGSIAALGDKGRMISSGGRAIREAVTIIDSSLSDMIHSANDRLSEAHKALASIDAAEGSIAAIEAGIEARQAQEKRLRAGLLEKIGITGKNRVGDRVPCIDADLSMIFDIIRRGYGSLSAASRIALPARIAARVEQAKQDIAAWIEENEVRRVGIRDVDYVHAQGRHHAAILYRVLADAPKAAHIAPSDIIDPCARCLVVPFDEAAGWVKQAGATVSNSAKLTPWTLTISEDGLSCDREAFLIHGAGFE